MNYREEVKNMASYLTEIKGQLYIIHRSLNSLVNKDSYWAALAEDLHKRLNTVEQLAQLQHDNYPSKETIKLLAKSLELEEYKNELAEY